MTQTTVEYTQSSSVHGVQYIFESGKNLAVSRILWVLFVIAAAGAGIFWSIEVSAASWWLFGHAKCQNSSQNKE